MFAAGAVKKMNTKVETSINPNVEIVICYKAPQAFPADYRLRLRAAPSQDGEKRLLDCLKAHGSALTDPANNCYRGRVFDPSVSFA